MELVLMAGAPVGVLLIVAFTWLLGGWKTATLADANAAVARYADDDPLFRPGKVLMAADNRAALIEQQGGGDMALVAAFGDRFITRRLGNGMLREARFKVRKKPELEFHLEDHTCPVIRFDASRMDDAARQDWLMRIAALAPSPHRAAA